MTNPAQRNKSRHSGCLPFSYESLGLGRPATNQKTTVSAPPKGQNCTLDVTYSGIPKEDGQSDEVLPAKRFTRL